MKDQPYLDTSPKISDEIRKTTCYMCACRCGINVHIKDGEVAYIEGNRDHPVNQGVLCAKGSAGIMQINAPSRLQAPLRRVGPRGSGEFEEISWEAALRPDLTTGNIFFPFENINTKIVPQVVNCIYVFWGLSC